MVGRDFLQSIGIRTITRTDDDHEIDPTGQLLHSALAILGCIANIVEPGAHDIGISLSQGGNQLTCVIER